MSNKNTDTRTSDSLPENSALIRGVDSIVSGNDEQVGDTSSGWLTQYSYKLWGPALQARSEQFEEYKQTVDRARMDTTWDEHLANTITISIAMGAIGAFLGVIIGAVLSYFGVFANLSLAVSLPPVLVGIFIPIIKNALGTVGLMLLTAVIIGGVTGVARYVMPYNKAYKRSRQINILLPQTITYIYAHSQGGMHLLDIIDRLAEEEETYGEVAVEFQAIRNNIEYFGNDMTTALQETRRVTPNGEFATLLDDFVSYVNTGGDLTSFLETKTHEFQRKARHREENVLESLDLVAEIYITAGVVLPLAILIIFVIITSLGGGALSQLFATVYLGIPLLGLLFLIIHSGVTTDRSKTAKTLPSPTTAPSPELINARLEDGVSPREALNPTETNRARTTEAARPVYSRIDGHDRELSAAERRGLADLRKSLVRERAVSAVKKPISKFRENPLYSLLFTVPIAFLYMLGITITGIAPLWPSSITSRPVWVTTVGMVLPLMFVLTPLSYLHERQFRYQRKVNKELPNILRKLSTTNTSGANLMDNIEAVARTSTGTIANELERTHRHLQWSISLNDALRRFANRVENARVTRVTKLLMEANTTSERVSDVLTVAAKAAQDQRDLDKERFAGMRQKIGVIAIGYIIFLAVALIVVAWLFPTFSEVGGTSGSVSNQSGALSFNFQINLYTMIYYHACLIQAIVTGLIAGKFGYNSVLSGLKFAISGIITAVISFVLLASAGIVPI